MDETTNKRLGELLAALANGNKEALSEIYKIMCRVLYVVGNVYFARREDIEDCIQDLLLSLFYKAKKFKKNTNACAWIITVYSNLIKDRLRYKKRGDNYIADEIEKFKIEARTSDAEYLDTHIFIKDIFDKLTEYEQNLLIYAYWCKCSIGEIAKIFNKPKSTIESQLHNLKIKIMKLS